jgi:hypothetical protein
VLKVGTDLLSAQQTFTSLQIYLLLHAPNNITIATHELLCGYQVHTSESISTAIGVIGSNAVDYNSPKLFFLAKERFNDNGC